MQRVLGKCFCWFANASVTVSNFWLNDPYSISTCYIKIGTALSGAKLYLALAAGNEDKQEKVQEVKRAMFDRRCISELPAWSKGHTKTGSWLKSTPKWIWFFGGGKKFQEHGGLSVNTISWLFPTHHPPTAIESAPLNNCLLIFLLPPIMPSPCIIFLMLIMISRKAFLNVFCKKNYVAPYSFSVRFLSASPDKLFLWNNCHDCCLNFKCCCCLLQSQVRLQRSNFVLYL